MLAKKMPYHYSHTSCLGWPQTSILLISASQLARITDMSHCTWQNSEFFTRNISFFSNFKKNVFYCIVRGKCEIQIVTCAMIKHVKK
jgi:hypothetical protein